jgi:hypothetical protein
MSQPGLEQELDQQWLVIKEESLLFNEGIVDIKFNDLDESKTEDEQDKQQEASKKSKRDKEKQVCKLMFDDMDRKLNSTNFCNFFLIIFETEIFTFCAKLEFLWLLLY